MSLTLLFPKRNLPFQHIDPAQCSSPKSDEKKKKKKFPLPPAPPAPPLFSSTAIFDTHAFFTQSNHTKTKKQKKKIDIARPPAVAMNNDPPTKKKGRTKNFSPYDFQDNEEENSTFSRSKGTKRLTDDIITARFAKNSHYQSHQTSMASVKSTAVERPKKKKKKNLLGIGSSSPLTKSVNATLSPGRLSTDDDSFLPKGHRRRKQTQRRRGK